MATFLVEAVTGQAALQGEEALGEVRDGSEGWVALAPSAGAGGTPSRGWTAP
ncbi:MULTISPECIES: hypothetical protein [Kitasatospora]|nr:MULTISPECIES: hypothetical protein [Kitasatospora]